MPSPVEATRARLRCGRHGCACRRGQVVHCPLVQNHRRGDAAPSLTVNQGREQEVVVSCKAGCDRDALIAALREMNALPGKEERPAPSRSQRIPPPPGELVAIYRYLTLTNIPLEKGRFEERLADGSVKKTFRWRREGATEWGGLGGIRQTEVRLFRIDQLPEDISVPVFFVEGEKAALACAAHGLFATTHAGGASTTDFGETLDALRGRTVYLWPDNDDAGRRYMNTVAARLRPIAGAIKPLEPPALAEKDDAADYFARGGTVEALLAEAVQEPDTSYMDGSTIRTRVPTPKGVFTFTFEQLEKTPRELNAELTLDIPLGARVDRWNQRINLQSISARSDMRRELEAIYGKTFAEWAAVIKDGVNLTIEAFKRWPRGERLGDMVPTGETPFLFEGIIPKGVPSIWWAKGGSNKTYLAMWLMLLHASGKRHNAIRHENGPALLVDFESDRGTFQFRMARLCAGMGLQPEQVPVFRWAGNGVPLAEQVMGIRDLVLREGISFAVIDSAGPACGDDPNKPSVAYSYYRAISAISDTWTTLSLAHVNKAGDEEYPLGTVAWVNQPRIGWLVKRMSEDRYAPEVDIELECKKVNDLDYTPRTFHISFGRAGGPVQISVTPITQEAVITTEVIANRLWAALNRPMTAAALSQRIGVPEERVRQVLLGDRRFTSLVGMPGIEPRWNRAIAAMPMQLEEESDGQ